MPPHPPALVAPRMNRGAPRLRASRAGAPTWPHTPQRLSITRIVNGPPQWPRRNRGAGCASINGELRRGGELLFRLAGGAREAAVHDLVEERLVADLQQARGLGPVPVDALEHLLDGQTLGVARRAPRD